MGAFPSHPRWKNSPGPAVKARGRQGTTHAIAWQGAGASRLGRTLPTSILAGLRSEALLSWVVASSIRARRAADCADAAPATRGGSPETVLPPWNCGALGETPEQQDQYPVPAVRIEPEASSCLSRPGRINHVENPALRYLKPAAIVDSDLAAIARDQPAFVPLLSRVPLHGRLSVRKRGVGHPYAS